MISLSKLLKQDKWNQVVVLLLLLLLLGLAGIPGYITGQWEWKQPLPVSTIKELRQIRKMGLSLPGWQTIEQAQPQVGEKKWTLQVIKQQNSQTQAMLLLLPQNSPKDQPEVEWSEINGWGRLRWRKWDIAETRLATFTLKQPTAITVEARYFRASTPQETFAVLQWYALPNGGHPSPLRWFLADQLAQWGKQRTPWVGVSILIPMEPLGQVETVWPLAESLGKTVQSALMTAALENQAK
ncbi:cyanoexosortase B system-associated protein [Fortiea contorta]|uniref:cyanoexosortase B system-associated protein n=1 Tax=Fortiea contorta TaxID=1892405 RepID=UPI00034D7674|nr:cyanoexosortase B system-associated protein [Fortiea contorta]